MKAEGIEPDELNRRIKLAAAEQNIFPVRTEKKEGNTEAYPKGTIIEIEHKNTRYFYLPYLSSTII